MENSKNELNYKIKQLEIRAKELEINNDLLWVYVKTLQAQINLINTTNKLHIAAFDFAAKTH